MGYTTDFSGSFEISPPLHPTQAAYIAKFNETRRVRRDAEVTAERSDPVREAAGLPVGVEGGYFVGADGLYGQEHNAKDILDDNNPPAGQPGLWCQWTVDTEPDVLGNEIPNGAYLKWDQGEKFYNYTEWLEYIIDHFMKPWGRTLNGVVHWQGEDSTDVGKITVQDNVVTVQEPQWT